MTANVLKFQKKKKIVNSYTGLDIKPSDVIEQFKRVLENLSLKGKDS